MLLKYHIRKLMKSKFGMVYRHDAKEFLTCRYCDSSSCRLAKSCVSRLFYFSICLFPVVFNNYLVCYLFSIGCCMDCAWNILSHKVSSWLSARGRSVFDPQYCEYCGIYQMPQRCANWLCQNFYNMFLCNCTNTNDVVFYLRCKEADPTICHPDPCITGYIHPTIGLHRGLSHWSCKIEIILKRIYFVSATQVPFGCNVM